MDDADKAAEREDITIREAMRASKQPVGPVPTGLCHWCGETLDDVARWCPDTECREMWDKQRRFKR